MNLGSKAENTCVLEDINPPDYHSEQSSCLKCCLQCHYRKRFMGLHISFQRYFFLWNWLLELQVLCKRVFSSVTY